jgi:hypothetical protein
MTRGRHLIALALAAATVGGCGDAARHTTPPPAPKLSSALAEQLAAQSDDVAAKLDAGDGCGALAAAQELQRRTIAAINADRVPAALQEPLSAAANDLPARIHCAPPPPVDEKHHGKGHKGHGKHDREGD